MYVWRGNLSNVKDFSWARDLFMSFGMIVWDIIFGWYYNILGWKLSKQTSYWSQTGFFLS